MSAPFVASVFSSTLMVFYSSWIQNKVVPCFCCQTTAQADTPCLLRPKTTSDHKQSHKQAFCFGKVSFIKILTNTFKVLKIYSFCWQWSWWLKRYKKSHSSTLKSILNSFFETPSSTNVSESLNELKQSHFVHCIISVKTNRSAWLLLSKLRRCGWWEAEWTEQLPAGFLCWVEGLVC